MRRTGWLNRFRRSCKGRSISMEKLDTLVTEHLLERLFKPERIAVILASLSSRRVEQAVAVNARILGSAARDDRRRRQAQTTIPIG